MKKVTIIDYGMSNLLSISRAIEKIGMQVELTPDAETAAKAEILILPGVGAFYDGMRELEQRNLPEAIHAFVKTGKPFLGICLGMQMMLGEGTEVKPTKGLGIIPGKVLPLPAFTLANTPNKIPHIGWAEVVRTTSDADSIIGSGNDYMYFVHSFYANPDHHAHAIATTPFSDIRFTSVVNRENAWGTQFHPEKSGEAGLNILRTFCNL